MSRHAIDRASLVACLILFAAAIVVELELARPFRSASIAYDSQASVLFFERIVAGRPIEEFVPTTSKPVLTGLFGLLYAGSHDWRTLAWLTLLANALAVTLAAILARRVGGDAAGVFVGAALANSGGLLFDVGFALATPYALIGWAVAGLALTGSRPRYAVAGLALAWATLARIETLVVVGAIAAGLAAQWLWARRQRRQPPSWGAWLVPILAALAVPLLMLHDQLLAGDPMLWTRVSAIYSEQTSRHILSPLQVVTALVSRYWGMGAVSLLALIGLLRLMARGQRWTAWLLVAHVLGIAALLVSVAARHIYVTIRYATAIDVGVVFAAGIGIAAVSVAALDWPPFSRLMGRARVAAPRLTAGLAIAAITILVTGPYDGQNPELRTGVRASLTTAERADAALSAVRQGLAAPCADPAIQPRLIAPGSIRHRLVVDLGLELPAVTGATPATLAAALESPLPCAVILHVRASDGAGPEWATFEIDAPREAGRARLEPLLADTAAGVWVVAVR